MAKRKIKEKEFGVVEKNREAYTEKNLERTSIIINFIAALQEIGISLDEIKNYTIDEMKILTKLLASCDNKSNKQKAG